MGKGPERTSDGARHFRPEAASLGFRAPEPGGASRTAPHFSAISGRHVFGSFGMSVQDPPQAPARSNLSAVRR